jgi:trigger factor
VKISFSGGNLKVTKEKVENSQAFLTIEMEPAEMEAGMQDSYRHLSQKANIPGFRKGKAPRAVVERHLGKPRLLEEAIDHMLPQAYEQALKEQEIEPFAQPEVEIAQTDPLIFKAVVPLTPTVELGDYRGIRMSPETVDITDDKINQVFEELRHQHATWEPVERPLDYDDMAVIDIDGEVEEKPYVKKIGAQYQVLRDAITPAPGFVQQIVGMKKEEEKEFTLSFPGDYPNSQVAGKEARFKVKLSEIKEEKLPELNDDFAKQVSPEFKTLETLREEVVKSLQVRGEENARMDFEEKVINAVIEESRVDYPPILVEMEINRILNEQVRQLQMSGRGLDEYLQSINKTEEQLREELRPVAAKNVTASLVLGKVAEDEKIDVNDADIENGINNMTRGAAEDKKEELRKLLDTPQTRQSMTQSLRTRKTIERLTEIARNTGDSKKETKEPTKKVASKEKEKDTKEEVK